MRRKYRLKNSSGTGIVAAIPFEDFRRHNNLIRDSIFPQLILRKKNAQARAVNPYCQINRRNGKYFFSEAWRADKLCQTHLFISAASQFSENFFGAGKIIAAIPFADFRRLNHIFFDSALQVSAFRFPDAPALMNPLLQAPQKERQALRL